MKSITLKQKRYVDALARLGHFGHAAEACAISQPALSMQIKELEAALGTPLFERGARQVRLTGFGEEAVARLREILRGVDDDNLRRLSRSLRTKHADSGDILLRKEAMPRRVFFIASGAVELELGGQTWRMGRGEMFGQMALLLQRTRRAEARAIVPTTLLYLDEQRFLRLLKRSENLRAAVRESAERRGIDIADLIALE